jgi:hypothetical protein
MYNVLILSFVNGGTSVSILYRGRRGRYHAARYMYLHMQVLVFFFNCLTASCYFRTEGSFYGIRAFTYSEIFFSIMLTPTAAMYIPDIV